MEIYIIRHGRTLWNREQRLQGSSDIELSESGRIPARESSENMKNIHFDRIFASPLKRAYETACILRRDREIEIVTDHRIQELNFGSWEGQTMEELNSNPECGFKYFFDSPELYVAAEDGESLEHLCERAASFMKEQIEPLAESCERVLIVAHGAVNKAMMTHVKKHDISQFWAGGLQRNCGVIMMNYKNGKYDILEENKLFYELKEKNPTKDGKTRL